MKQVKLLVLDNFDSFTYKVAPGGGVPLGAPCASTPSLKGDDE